MHTFRNILERIKKIFPEKYWNDPVYSRLIASSIYALTFAVIGLFWTIIKSLCNEISFGKNLNSIFQFLNQSFVVKNYIILLALVIVFHSVCSFINRVIQHRNQTSKVAKAFPGKWKCNWIDKTNPSNRGFEYFVIKKGKYYYKNGERKPSFVIEDLDYPHDDTILFTKRSLKKGADRVLHNKLKIINGNQLLGTEEENIEIEYTKTDFK